jgi:hypothetical protein
MRAAHPLDSIYFWSEASRFERTGGRVFHKGARTKMSAALLFSLGFGAAGVCILWIIHAARKRFAPRTGVL